MSAITVFYTVSISIPIAAQPLEVSDSTVAEIDAQAKQMRDIVTLPIKGMRAVQSDGQIVFLSDNGRFVFTGQMVDAWYKTPLNTLDEMRESGARIDFKRMGLDIDSLNTVSMGSGPQPVIAFVDPRCQYCHALMNDATALNKQYTFKFVTIPVLGEESHRLAKALSCAKNKKQALTALQNNTLDRLPTQKTCSSLDGMPRPGVQNDRVRTAQIVLPIRISMKLTPFIRNVRPNSVDCFKACRSKGMYNLQEQIVYDFEFVPHGDERACALEHIKILNSGDLIVFDRGYFSYQMLHEIIAHQRHAVFRMKRGTVNGKVADFWNSDKKDEIIEYIPSKPVKHVLRKRGQASDFPPLTVRLIKHTSGEETYVYATTLMDSTHIVNQYSEAF